MAMGHTLIRLRKGDLYPAGGVNISLIVLNPSGVAAGAIRTSLSALLCALVDDCLGVAKTLSAIVFASSGFLGVIDIGCGLTTGDGDGHTDCGDAAHGDAAPVVPVGAGLIVGVGGGPARPNCHELTTGDDCAGDGEVSRHI